MLSVGPGPVSPVSPVSHPAGHGSPAPVAVPGGILTPESSVQTWMDIRVGTYPNVSFV